MAIGDHLLVKRKKWFFSYYHHGIDIGDNKVIHLTGPRKKDAKVIETSLDEFLNGGVLEVWEYITFIDILRNYHSDMKSEFGQPHWMLPLLDEERISEIEARIKDTDRTVAEARKYLGRRGYNLFSDNCEHFAVFCKTGLAVSLQSINYQKHIDLNHGFLSGRSRERGQI
jgi:hypothetical protein